MWNYSLNTTIDLIYWKKGEQITINDFNNGNHWITDAMSQLCDKTAMKTHDKIRWNGLNIWERYLYQQQKEVRSKINNDTTNCRPRKRTRSCCLVVQNLKATDQETKFSYTTVSMKTRPTGCSVSISLEVKESMGLCKCQYENI